MTNKHKIGFVLIALLFMGLVAGVIVSENAQVYEEEMRLNAKALPEDTMGSEYKPLRWDGYRSLFAQEPPEELFDFIDVSRWQTEIDHPNICTEAVIVRASAADSACNMYVDSYFEANAVGFTEAGKYWGAYHFFRPNCSPEDQADLFVNTIQNYDWVITPVIDVEVDGGLSPDNVGDRVIRFLNRVEDRLGIKGMIYTSPGFWNDNVIRHPIWQEYDLWNAHWVENIDWVILPMDWDEMVMWQWAVLPNGIECGVSSTNLDNDVFMGTKEQFIEKYIDEPVVSTCDPEFVWLKFRDENDVEYTNKYVCVEE